MYIGRVSLGPGPFYDSHPFPGYHEVSSSLYPTFSQVCDLLHPRHRAGDPRLKSLPLWPESTVPSCKDHQVGICHSKNRDEDGQHYRVQLLAFRVYPSYALMGSFSFEFR